MTRYVIGPDVAMRLAHDQIVIGDDHQILAPTLLRSQLLSLLYQAVSRGEMTKKGCRATARLRARAANSTARRPRTSGSRLESRRPARMVRHLCRRVRCSDSTPGRRIGHTRRAARPCCEGPGGSCTNRGAVLTWFGDAQRSSNRTRWPTGPSCSGKAIRPAATAQRATSTRNRPTRTAGSCSARRRASVASTV